MIRHGSIGSGLLNQHFDAIKWSAGLDVLFCFKSGLRVTAEVWLYTKYKMMICGFELVDIDWTNQDVSKIVEFVNKKFNTQNEEIARLGDTLPQLQDRIKQLGGEVPQTKPRRDHS